MNKKQEHVNVLINVPYEYSLFLQFDLVCSHGHLPKISQSAFYFGYLVGAWLSGSVADM